MKRFGLSAFAVIMLIAGCSDSTAPRHALVGEYGATVFTLVTGADTVDVLQDGGVLYLNLASDSTFTGRLGGGEDTVDISGSFTNDAGNVKFSTEEITLLDLLVFRHRRGVLEADMADDATHYHVVLEPMDEVLRDSKPGSSPGPAAE